MSPALAGGRRPAPSLSPGKPPTLTPAGPNLAAEEQVTPSQPGPQTLSDGDVMWGWGSEGAVAAPRLCGWGGGQGVR